MSATVRPVNLEERRPTGATALNSQQDESERRFKDIRLTPSYGPVDILWAPSRSDRLSRTTHEKHEGHGTSSADRFRPEDMDFQNERDHNGRLEADWGEDPLRSHWEENTFRSRWEEDVYRYLSNPFQAISEPSSPISSEHSSPVEAECPPSARPIERPSFSGPNERRSAFPSSFKLFEWPSPSESTELLRSLATPRKLPSPDNISHAYNSREDSPPRTSMRPTLINVPPKRNAVRLSSSIPMPIDPDSASNGRKKKDDKKKLKVIGKGKLNAFVRIREPPPPPEAPIDKEEDSLVASESLSAISEQEEMSKVHRPKSDTNETTRAIDARAARNIDIKDKIIPMFADHERRKQEEVKFRSSEPGVHPSAFGWTEEHLILSPTDEDFFLAMNPLGHGSLGVVDEVRRIGGQFPTLVRKRVELPLPKRQAAAFLKIVQEETNILRSLVHPHIVTLVGSYEDMKQPRRPSYCLLMSPVGENDLEAFLDIVGEHDITSEFSKWSRNCIRNWMACLASALEYMHASGVRHQDIKPSNIIHKGDHIFFTDFSSSSSFKVGHTTSTENPARSTPMYGAPEVTSDRGKHGRGTDIFSLGCVFADMLSVAEGRTVVSFQDYLRNDGQPAATDATPLPWALRYSEKILTIEDWFVDSHIFNTHVLQMLHPDRKVRPSATEVLQAFILNEVCDVSCSCLRMKMLQKELDVLSVVSVD